MICVWYVYELCMVCACVLYVLCMMCVWCVYDWLCVFIYVCDVRMMWVWSCGWGLYGVCMVRVRIVCVCVCAFYDCVDDVCLICVWCVYVLRMSVYGLPAISVWFAYDVLYAFWMIGLQTCVWLLYYVCLVCVRCVYVCCMIVCMKCVWFVYVLRMLFACCLWLMCMSCMMMCVWCAYDVYDNCINCVWVCVWVVYAARMIVYDLCMTLWMICVWLLYGGLTDVVDNLRVWCVYDLRRIVVWFVVRFWFNVDRFVCIIVWIAKSCCVWFGCKLCKLCGYELWMMYLWAAYDLCMVCVRVFAWFVDD